MTGKFERENASPSLRSEIALWPVALFLALGSFAFLVDLPVALWFKHHHLPRVLRDLIEMSETFAHGASVAVILAGFYILDRSNRKHLLRLIIMAYGSGLITDLLKLTVERIRPRDFSFAGGVWTTFQGWLPLLTHTGRQSFPSSHAAVTVGLAMGLAVVYPRARWYFAMLAVLASLQRLQCGAHYPSDVLFAAAVAWAFCWWLNRYGMPMQRVPTA
ncbi:MAG: phosphatase PAP2 family protein [Thermogutta sp.]